MGDREFRLENVGNIIISRFNLAKKFYLVDKLFGVVLGPLTLFPLKQTNNIKIGIKHRIK